MIRIKPLKDEEIISRIVSVVKKYLPEAKVYLFGSRALGNYRENSDFDVGIEWIEKIPFSTLFRIKEELENLPTLKSFDVVDLKGGSEEFANFVKERGLVLYDGKGT